MNWIEITYLILGIVFIIMSLSIFFKIMDHESHSIVFQISYILVSIILLMPFLSIVINNMESNESIKAVGFILVIGIMNIILYIKK